MLVLTCPTMWCAQAFAADRGIIVTSDEPASTATNAQSSKDFQIFAGSEGVIPVSVEAGEPIIDVVIDGRGPFPMTIGTGTEDTLAPEAAALLGLEIKGSGTEHTSSGRTMSNTSVVLGIH